MVRWNLDFGGLMICINVLYVDFMVFNVLEGRFLLKMVLGGGEGIVIEIVMCWVFFFEFCIWVIFNLYKII